MSADFFRYDILAQEALLGVVRRVLFEVAENGLPGDHYFYISFDTSAPGVQMSDRLHAQYPEEMKIILQHQFRDLTVTDQAFEVELSFAGVSERLSVPFAAIRSFFDPSVQFGLQFQTIGTQESAVEPAPDKGAKRPAAGPKATLPERADRRDLAMAAPDASDTGTTSPDAAGDPDKSGGEVVRLDRFRKK